MKYGSLNVISAKQLKELLLEITQSVADVISGTFGPYGQNTIIQTMDSVYATKDGWNVMQMLKVRDTKGENSITANALKKLLQDCAQATLLNAGDGTSTVTIASAKLNGYISEYLKTHKFDSKTIETALRTCCKEIEHTLLESATLINDDNMADIIYQIALISTNWDDEISGLIRDIYVKTKNPIIKVEDSGNLDTYAEYIDGYDLNGYVELPNYTLTSHASGKFEAKHPLILTFGSTVHKDKLDPLSMAAQLCAQRGRKLVLLAPTYDLDFLNNLKLFNETLINQGQSPLPLVPLKYFAKISIDRDCVEDFATAIGSVLLTNEFEDLAAVMEELKKLVIAEKTPDSTPIDKKPSPRKKLAEKDKETIIMRCISTLERLGGTCEKIEATDKYILASGLTNKNEEEFRRRKEMLENELELKYKQCTAESSLTDMIRVKRLRLGKMQCNMGVIKIGGFGSSHLKSKKDSIDDATRACEVAYQNGYIMDGGMAIPMAILDTIKKWEPQEGTTPTSEDNLVLEFLHMFESAFVDVATVLFNNKYDDVVKSKNLVASCLTERRCYDLIKEEYTESLITPVDVCREVLNGCLRLVLINATSNQFVFMNEDDLIHAIQYSPNIKTDDEDDEEE